ncbi:hypothetical protein SSCG_03929 [Streptomyces clavuligerus]|nr:hypothetical protein SSCG_03929 [Streptomyces clavuligerus]
MRLSPLELRLRHWGPPGEWFCTPYSSAPGDLCWDAGSQGHSIPVWEGMPRRAPVTSLKRALG